MLKGGFPDTHSELLQDNPEIEALVCQLCFDDLVRLNPDQRQAHYDEHLNADFQEFNVSRSGSIPKPPLKPRPVHARHPKAKKTGSFIKVNPEKANRFWYPAMSPPPPPNFTPGLIPVLKKALLKSHTKGKLQKAALCYERATHISTELWDLGWGCGYRNFLMACASLMDQQVQPTYFPLLDGPLPPGIHHLQQWIEDAWTNGFDEEGAQQLKHKLVGTSKWIGTAELYVAFISRSIPAELVDFDLNTQGPQALIEWVISYFSNKAQKADTVNGALIGASPVAVTERMPLVLQYAGHSRTIVGYEVLNTGEINLLVFDPSRRPHSALRLAAMASVPPSHISIPTASHSHYILSPSKVLHKIVHPLREIRKRKFPEEEHSEVIDVDADAPAKRIKGNGPSRDDLTDNAIRIDVSDAPVPVPPTVQARGELALSHWKVIAPFRLSVKQLAKKKNYQILWFPLTAPLTEQERSSRRKVMSVKVA